MNRQNRHPCDICHKPVGTGKLMCSQHWRLVPKALQHEVYRTWGRVRRGEGTPQQQPQNIAAYRKAREAAVQSAWAAASNQPGGEPMNEKKKPAAPSPALHAILELAERLARKRESLGQLVLLVNGEIEGAKARRFAKVKALADDAAAAWSALEAAVTANPELFVKPRKLAAHGIAFGYEKGKGGLEIADAEKTLQLIRRHFPELADVLIATKEAPAKDALANLTAAELKKLGVEVKGTGDVVVIRPADGAIDKLVKALVAAATEEAAQGSIAR